MERQRIGSDIREIRQVFSVEELLKSKEIESGSYPGRWSGYVVRFKDLLDRQWEFNVARGVRGVNVPCGVIVDAENGKIEVV